MVERVFLGWDRPFLACAVDWLLDRQGELPRLLVVVPTSQSGRRLREALAEQAGALLSPKIVTPGSLLKTSDPNVATDWMERVAWVESLENIQDWSIYQELFPKAPDESGEWISGFAMEMVRLRHALQENGQTLASAARLLSGSVEAGRWEELAQLEFLMERRLRSWGLKSRSQVLANGVTLPHGITGCVLAGITEMPPLIEKTFLAWTGHVNVLVGAPDAEASLFSPIGKPLIGWSDRPMPWPEGAAGSVRLVADSRQQASEAFRAVAEKNNASSDVALGSADVETGDEIAHTFTRGGWPAFHPATVPVSRGLARWFQAWTGWLKDPKLTIMADLLSLPESAFLLGCGRAQLTEELSRLRNEWMATRPDDLRHRIAGEKFRSDAHRQRALEVINAAETLERWRTDFLRGDFSETMERMLRALAESGPDTATESAAITTWLEEAAPLLHQTKRGAGFWIDLMLSSLPTPAAQPPIDRVIDVQGWLELLYEPGSHLVLCGMNEGNVPARNIGDPWLGEAAGRQLGLTVNADRAARDAFLYQSMLETRKKNGRVDVICAKSGAGGESLLPSRLLLAAGPSDLPQRVKFLFRGIEPPEAGLRWHADWKWQTRGVEIRKNLNVTSLTTYLACPFRFYLKHAVGMQRPEPDRVEWNARDFGNVAHDVMERWGRDPEARDFSKTEALYDWLSAELDRIVGEWFGSRVPLAVRVQTEALRQRLGWLARVQACSRAEGWEIIEVENKIEIPFGDTVVAARIDRIDRHRQTGKLRVIDYKTGRVKAVEAEHRRKITNQTVLPEHFGENCPVLHTRDEQGKSNLFRWTNLQLPLYALAIVNREELLPTPCYFTLGATEADVAIHQWDSFSRTDLEAARACTEWIVTRIREGVFWPPAEKVPYDDFAVLASGRNLEEMFLPVPPAPSA